jgi:hypothetical protein
MRLSGCSGKTDQWCLAARKSELASIVRGYDGCCRTGKTVGLTRRRLSKRLAMSLLIASDPVKRDHNVRHID